MQSVSASRAQNKSKFCGDNSIFFYIYCLSVLFQYVLSRKCSKYWCLFMKQCICIVLDIDGNSVFSILWLNEADDYSKRWNATSKFICLGCDILKLYFIIIVTNLNISVIELDLQKSIYISPIPLEISYLEPEQIANIVNWPYRLATEVLSFWMSSVRHQRGCPFIGALL